MPLGLAAKSVAASDRPQDDHHDEPDRRRLAPISAQFELKPQRSQQQETQAIKMAPSGTESKQHLSQPAAEANDKRKIHSEADEKRQQQANQLAASLRSAAAEGKVDLVRLLLKCGADVSAPDDESGNTPLHQAAWNGFSETVQVLCKHRANTNAKNKASFTPLHMASQQGHNQTSRLLLMANGRAELKNSYGDTPLHTATRYGHAGVARILLSAKCNPNQVNMIVRISHQLGLIVRNNDTPLHIAAAMGRRKLTKILMQNGAELVIKNKQNETAMDIALRKDLIEIQELIANPPPKASHRDCRGGHHKSHHKSHHHHNHHHHHHHRHQQNGRHEQQQQTRHRKSMTNLISGAGGGGGLEQARLRFQGLSISSNNVQCATKLVECAETSRGDAMEPIEIEGAAKRLAQLEAPPAGRLGMQRDHHELDVVEGAANKLARKSQLVPGANERRQRAQTLGASLGVSAAALDELAGSGAKKSELARAGADSRPRPSSAAGLDKQQELQLAPTIQLRVRPPRLRLSPNGSLRSSRAGGAKLRGGRGLAPKPRRRLSLASGLPDGSQLVELQPDPFHEPQPLKAKRRATSVSILNGRLSLAQLRKMVKRRAAADSRRPSLNSARANAAGLQQAVAPEVAAGVVGDEQNESSQQAGGQTRQRLVAGGRRQERLEREQSSSMVAPNGTKLTVSKPMAPLDDDTQLYAIPRKSSAKTKQQRPFAPSSGATLELVGRARDQPDADGQEAAPPPSEAPRMETRAERQPPSGPALTASESNQSLASVGGLSPVADIERHLDSTSSADEFIKSLAPVTKRANSQRSRRHSDLEQDDMQDLSAPGYSVIGRRDASPERQAEPESAATTMSANRRESTGPCTCLLEPEADYDKQVAAGVRVVVVGSEERSADGINKNNADEQPDHGDQGELLLARSGPTGRVEPSETSRLIRPRSVLGGASAELVAAQKSLATAAAAKVQRDRLAKMALSRQPETRSPDNDDNHDDDEDGRKFQQLTVATQLAVRPDFWLQHHQQNQTLVATATARLQTKPSVLGQKSGLDSTCGGKPVGVGVCGGSQPERPGLVQRRDGTNSVGMSDSSPSNNGADSDNSSQTRTSNSVQLETDSQSALGNGDRKQSGMEHRATSGSNVSVAAAATDAKREQPSRPFGILSRILSHNKSSSLQSVAATAAAANDDEKSKLKEQHVATEGNAPKRTNNNSSRRSAANGLKRIVQTIANGQGATKTINKQQEPKQPTTMTNTTANSSSNNNSNNNSNHFNGSLSSSSALSSPSISTTGQSPSSTADSVTGLHQGGDAHETTSVGTAVAAAPQAASNSTAEDEGCALDEDEPIGAPQWQQPASRPLLGSRSRLPIVLTAVAESTGLPVAQSTSPPPPRLPPKGALECPAGGDPDACRDFINRDPLASGLPTVASGQHVAPHQNHNHHLDQSLCSYHALNRSHQIQAKYSPYLPYSLGRYSIHETCDPSTSCGGHLQQSKPHANYPLDQYYPTQFLGNPASNGQHFQMNGRMTGSNQQQGAGDSASLLNASMVCHYSQDDSIYIPPNLTPNASVQDRALVHLNGDGIHDNYQRHLPEVRPKSSLGALGLSGQAALGGAQQNYQSRTQINIASGHSYNHPMIRLGSGGALQSSNQDENGGHLRPVSILKSSHQIQAGHLEQAKQLSHTTNFPNLLSLRTAQFAENGAQQQQQVPNTNLNQIFDSSHHLITQNSIYAPSNAYDQHQKCSQLTVLPTSSHTTNPAYGLQPIGRMAEAIRDSVGGDLQPVAAGEQLEDEPPKLPPKTTTTTVGKLTRVSINPTSSSGARGELLMVKNSAQRRAHDEANDQKVHCEGAKVTSC